MDAVLESRIKAITRQGGICISGRVYNHVRQMLDLKYAYLGEFYIKAANDPVRIYRVLLDNEIERDNNRDKFPRVMSHGRIFAVFVFVILIAAVFPKLETYVRKSGNIIRMPAGSEQKIHVFSFGKENKTIAVIPLYDHSFQNSRNYLNAGINENLLNSFCLIPGFYSMKKKQYQIPEGSGGRFLETVNKLGADYIVTLRVRKIKNILHASANMVDAHDGTQIGLKVYNREINGEEVNEILEDIAVRIANDCMEMLEKERPIKQLITKKAE